MSTAITAKRARMELEDVWFCYQTLLALSHLPPPPVPQPSSRTARADQEKYTEGTEKGEAAKREPQSEPQSRTKAEAKARRPTGATTPTASKKERSTPAGTPTAGSKTNRAAAATAPSTPAASASSQQRRSDNAAELYQVKIQTILSNMAALTESVAHVQAQNEALEAKIKQETEKQQRQKRELEQQQEEEQMKMTVSSGDFALSISTRDLDDAYRRQVEKVRQVDRKNDLLRNEIEALEDEIKQREKIAHIKQKNMRSSTRREGGEGSQGTPASPDARAHTHGKGEREKSLSASVPPRALSADTGAAASSSQTHSGGALGPPSSFAAWMDWVTTRKEISKTAEWKMKIVSLLEAIQVDGDTKEREENASESEGDTKKTEALDELGQEAIACAESVKKYMKEQKRLILEVEKAAARQRGRAKVIRRMSDDRN